jgi:hypothetical protein
MYAFSIKYQGRATMFLVVVTIQNGGLRLELLVTVLSDAALTMTK